MTYIYEKMREQFATAVRSWTADDWRCILLDLADYGKAISGATNATPIVVTATSHGFSNGDVVAIIGVGGNTAANGRFRIANVAANTFELTNYDTGANVAGAGGRDYERRGRAWPSEYDDQR